MVHFRALLSGWSLLLLSLFACFGEGLSHVDELEEFPLKFVSILVLLGVPAPEDGSQVGGAGGDLAQAEVGGCRRGLLGK